MFFALSATSALANSVDLVWEADTYTPALYLGHSGATPGSRIKVVASAVFTDNTGKPIDAKTLNYQWSKDGQVLPTVSGAGKDTIIFTIGDSPATITAIASTADQSIRQTSTIRIVPTAPELIVYEEDPLFGVADQVVLPKDFRLDKPEIMIRAEPFYFSRSSVAQKRLQYDWKLNNQTIITDPENPHTLTISKPEQGAGNNSLSLAVKNLSQLLQNAAAQFTISFDDGDTF